MTTKSAMRAATREEAKARGFVIPPAYTDLRLAVDPKADLQVLAHTPKNKTAYFYSKEFVERQVRLKWKRVDKLMRSIDAVEKRVSADSEGGSDEDREVAMTIRLIMQTGLRNGNKKQGEKDSYGASSLRMEHVQHAGARVLLHFPGKHGVSQSHDIADAVLASYVRERQDAGAEVLFPHTASDTLRYFRKVAGRAVKVHDLRTWYANVLATALVAKLVGETPSIKKLKKAVATQVSEKLGNKPSQALKSYINPRVFGE
jgi:DNA topoisomerase-1